MDDAAPNPNPELSTCTIMELVQELKSRSTMGAIVLEPRHQDAGAQNQVVCFFANGNSTALLGLLAAVQFQVCAQFVARNFSDSDEGSPEAGA
jgi:hypothetical protein